MKPEANRLRHGWIPSTDSGNLQKALISGEPASAACTGVSERSLARPVATDLRDVSMKAFDSLAGRSPQCQCTVTNDR